MTTVQTEAMKKYAETMIDYIPPCPWNPFPRDSEWGQQIERGWRKFQASKRRRIDSGYDDWYGNGR